MHINDIEHPKAREHLRHLGKDGKMLLELHFKDTGCENVECIHQVEDRVQWRLPAKTINSKGGVIK